MGIVQFPTDRLDGQAERLAFRHGMARSVSASRSAFRILAGGRAALFCTACAAPVDFGAVWRGEDVYCSVECSLGGNRPA